MNVTSANMSHNYAGDIVNLNVGGTKYVSEFVYVS